MPSAKQHGPIETMQVIAWCAEVQRASGMTLGKLKKQCFDGENAPKFEFRLFSTGGRLPDDKTLDLIENTYPGTREIFDIGPDKRPLWALLSDECDEDLCLEALDDWLFTGFTARDVASVPKAELKSRISQLKSLSLEMKTGLAWEKMVRLNEVDFERFDAGEESHCLWEAAEELDALLDEFEAFGVKIEKPVNVEELLKSPLLDDEQKDAFKQWSDYFHATAPKVDDVIGILALRRLAECRRECQSEARYLFLGIRPFIDGLFSEWNIGSRLNEFLSSWSRVPTSPAVIADANQRTAQIVKILRAESRDKHPAAEARVLATMLNRFKR